MLRQEKRNGADTLLTLYGAIGEDLRALGPHLQGPSALARPKPHFATNPLRSCSLPSITPQEQIAPLRKRTLSPKRRLLPPLCLTFCQDRFELCCHLTQRAAKFPDEALVPEVPVQDISTHASSFDTELNILAGNIPTGERFSEILKP